MPSTLLSEFKQNGFAIPSVRVAESEISRLTEELASTTIGHGRAGTRHAMRHDAVASLSRHPVLLEIAKQILGNTAFPFRATVFDKSPKANWLVVWHQDTALPLRERRDVPGWGPWSTKDGVIYAHAPAAALSGIVALRLHLDDTTTENGCLRVLPGTHQNGVLTDADVEHLSKKRKPHDCVVARGEVLAMSPLIVHSSSKSRVEKPRRVLHVEYAASEVCGDGMRLAFA